MRILVGTSGWQYDSWKERFYPKDLPKKEWLPYFSARFPTVEVNNTFYNLPRPETFSAWRAASADGFVICIKASRFITHLKRLLEPEEPVKLLWERCRRLGKKLGPVLFQLPPSMKVDLERLDRLLAALPARMRPAFEFRHPSWEVDEVYERLDQAGAALVIPDRPGLRAPRIVTGGWSYVRFHQGNPVGPHYPKTKLRRWAERVLELDAAETYVYFNNDPLGAAIRDAYTFADLLQEGGADVVPLLRDAA
ncbi:MAG TPA: DUF72 domain-containing protein [Actinomycetota bacterium]|nr:DUF72 domain-containing protein [Actinomycetota bacterium]